MSTAAIQPKMPCLGTAEPLWNPPFSKGLNTIQKAVIVATAILSLIGMSCFIAGLLPLGLIFYGAALLPFFIGLIIDTCRATRPEEFVRLEKLPLAETLGETVAISPELKAELSEVVPTLQGDSPNPRIASFRVNADDTVTFVLQRAPDLQFTVRKPKEVHDCFLARQYENAVYAHQICQSEHFSSLIVPPMKPIHLKVKGELRTLLAEKILPHAQNPDQASHGAAVREMVRFLLKTGGTGPHGPIPFLPLAGGKLALQGLTHLVKTPDPDAPGRDVLEVEMILDDSNSLLSSLNREDLINVALDELKSKRPMWSNIHDRPMSIEERTQIMDHQIDSAKQARLAKLRAANDS